jgi:predicted RNA-binding Zn-ribbon protein involved in translation (DUF1610 family)/transposase-like protein
MKYTISQFKNDFPNDDACLDYVFKARFLDIECPKCGKTKFFRVKGRKCYTCRCGYQIHPVSNTIFHKSDTKLTDWFFALYLMSQSKHGTSAKEIQRHLGTTYKTAWRIAKLIRGLMTQDEDKLNKMVEADEFYYGGKRRMSQRNTNKVSVVGMVQRGGKVKAKILEEVWTPTLLKTITDNVERGTYLLTDDNNIYPKVKRLGYFHNSVNHSKKEFVRNEVHTNTIEGVWSNLKRSIYGTYHAVSSKYLQDYINEFAFSYNSRFSSLSPFQILLFRLCRLPYEGGQKIPVFPLRISS